MKSCPKCSRENPDDVAFCVFCGNKFAIVCPNCGRENPVDVAFCGYCGTPRTNPPTKPEIAQPANPVSSQTSTPNTVKPARSVWFIGAIWAIAFTAIAAIGSFSQHFNNPVELGTSLIIGIPANFILWWLVFTFFTFLWRKTEGKKLVRIAAILLIIVLLCGLFYLGASFAGGGTFIAPTATQTSTPRSTSTPLPKPAATYSPYAAMYEAWKNLVIKTREDRYLDFCNRANGTLTVHGTITNNNDFAVRNISIWAFSCVPGTPCVSRYGVGNPFSEVSLTEYIERLVTPHQSLALSENYSELINLPAGATTAFSISMSDPGGNDLFCEAIVVDFFTP
jgi:hypothetical protein